MARSKPNIPTRTRRSSGGRRSASKKRSAPEAQPVSAAEFDAALNPLAPEEPIAVAVSGGADSLSALLLTIAWCKARGLTPPVAVTVDHGLRKESKAEAQRVAAWARKLGAPHETLSLVWERKRPEGNIQALARERRYQLLGTWARAHGAKTLITGHTLDDQAETFLIRLTRGSGLEGLSGMSAAAHLPVRGFRDIALLRPLLAFSHARLVATLRAAEQRWIEDPSNAAERFTRAKLRAASAVLENAGLTAERLSETASHLRRARQAIDLAVEALLATAARESEWGFILLQPPAFRAAPAEVSLRALARVITAVGGEAYPPRFETLEVALAWLIADDGVTKGRTLSGCRLTRRSDSLILVAREAAAIGGGVELRPGETAVWDRRYQVAVARSAPSAVAVAALGAKGLAVAGREAELPPVEPRLIAATGPAIWTGPRLVAAPLVKYFAADAASFGFSATFLGLAKGKGAAKGNSL